MKNINYFKTILQLSVIGILLFFQSCAKEDLKDKVSNQTNIENNQVVNKLIEMGFKIEDIVECENYYLVEGDIMFPKDEVPNKQAHTYNLVSRANVASMTVFVDGSMPSIGSDDWRPAVKQALNDLNNIQGSIVNFQLSFDPSSDIIVASDAILDVDDQLDDLVLAAAGFPLNNQPYNTIYVNLDFNSNTDLSDEAKRRNIIHELGHCIGLRHTNWASNGENSGSDGANLIPCTTAQDNGSVMNAGNAGTNFLGFSPFDLTAIRYLYPTYELPGMRVKEGSLDALWFLEWGIDVKDFQIEGDRIGILTVNGALRVKEGEICSDWVLLYGTGVSSFQLEGDRIAIKTTAGDLLVKEGGLSAAWIPEESNVKDFQLEENRIGILTTAGDLLVKEGGLSAAWIPEESNVKAFQLEEDRIGVLKAGVLKVKEGGLSTAWTSIHTGVKDFQLEEHRIAVLLSGCVLNVKQGSLNASWVEVESNVLAYKLDGHRIGVLKSGGHLTVKEGSLNASWVPVYSLGGVKVFQLDGDRVGIQTTDNVLRVKEGTLNAPWTIEWDNNVTKFQLDGDRIAIRSTL